MRHQSWRQHQQWSNPIRLLIVEPSEAVVRLLKDALLMGALSASVTQAKTPGEGLQYLTEDPCDLLLFSARFGVDPLRDFIQLYPDLPVIALTESQSEFAWLQSSVPGVLDNLPADSTGILSVGRKVQLAVHKNLTDKHQKNAQENIDRLGNQSGDTVGRQGGDEFLMILPRLSSPKAVKTVIKSVISRMKKPCTLWNAQLAVSCSIGIATCEKDDLSASEIYRRADLALYEAKKTKGYSSRFFDESLGNRLDQRIWFREAISQAAVNGELALHYQPQIDLKTGKVSGAPA